MGEYMYGMGDAVRGGDDVESSIDMRCAYSE